MGRKGLEYSFPHTGEMAFEGVAVWETTLKEIRAMPVRRGCTVEGEVAISYDRKLWPMPDKTAFREDGSIPGEQNLKGSGTSA